jgi:hypothetical protein
MAEQFLQLEAQEQSRIYRALSPKLARSPAVLEKDVWVCWALQTLFTIPDRLPMAFKGGTSLSKVFGVIARFSEDIDITLDYRGLDNSFDPFDKGVSKNRLKKFSQSLKSFVRNHVYNVVSPHFQNQMITGFNTDALRLEMSADGEQLRLHYPTVMETYGNYMGNSVLIEFGGRNIIEPSEEHEVWPDIAEHVTGLEIPHPTVNVLSPERTFWEKATLIHVECQREEFRSGVDRLSRHWYDLAMLAESIHGQTALTNRPLLEDVVKYKKVFYDASHANYEACLDGLIRLIPDSSALNSLHKDFKSMIDAGMFIGNPPDFDTILNRLRVLEAGINGMPK